MKDFNVDIKKLTSGVTQKGFGLILILGTTKDQAYKIYNNMLEVTTDYEEVTAEYKIASRILGQNPAPQQIAIMGKLFNSEEDEPAILTTSLNELVNSNSDWFFLTCTANSNTIITALSNWVKNANDKMYFVTSQDCTLQTTLDSDFTVVMFHNVQDAYVAEGLAAYLATSTVGGVTAKFKTITGVAAANIGGNELDQLHKDGGFSYVRKMGVLQTTEGITTSGEYIDVVMGMFFLRFRMEEEAALLAINSPKIPYNNEGISMLISVVVSVLSQGVENGIILRDENGAGVYNIDFKTRQDTPITDVENRIYDGIKWEAKLDGAIHLGNISGTLTY